MVGRSEITGRFSTLPTEISGTSRQALFHTHFSESPFRRLPTDGLWEVSLLPTPARLYAQRTEVTTGRPIRPGYPIFCTALLSGAARTAGHVERMESSFIRQTVARHGIRRVRVRLRRSSGVPSGTPRTDGSSVISGPYSIRRTAERPGHRRQAA